MDTKDHAICDDCWNKKNPQRMPIRLDELVTLKCCVCGSPTISGILARGDLKEFLCKGDHTKFTEGFGMIRPRTAEKN